MTTTFALVGGGLPPGLTLNPDGSITGTPTSATGGSYDFVVAATNSAGTTTALYRLPYLTLPTWNTYGGLLINWYPSDPTAATVQSLSVVATSTSGFPIAYVLSSGNLPPGCTIDESSGIISGVVGGGPNNAATTYTFGIAAYDSGFNNMVTRSFSIHVLAAPRPTATAKWTGPAYSNVFSGNKTIWAGAEIDWTLTGSMLGSDAILSAYTLTTTVDPAFPLISGLDLSNDGPVVTISGNIDPSLPTGTYTTHYLVSNPFIMLLTSHQS